MPYALMPYDHFYLQFPDKSLINLYVTYFKNKIKLHIKLYNNNKVYTIHHQTPKYS